MSAEDQNIVRMINQNLDPERLGISDENQIMVINYSRDLALNGQVLPADMRQEFARTIPNGENLINRIETLADRIATITSDAYRSGADVNVRASRVGRFTVPNEIRQAMGLQVRPPSIQVQRRQIRQRRNVANPNEAPSVASSRRLFE